MYPVILCIADLLIIWKFITMESSVFYSVQQRMKPPSKLMQSLFELCVLVGIDEDTGLVPLRMVRFLTCHCMILIFKYHYGIHWKYSFCFSQTEVVLWAQALQMKTQFLTGNMNLLFWLSYLDNLFHFLKQGSLLMVHHKSFFTMISFSSYIQKIY